MGWGVDQNIKIIHIEIDEEELTRISKPDAEIHADAADALPLIMEALGPQPDRSGWVEKVARVKQEVQKL